jgi:hypothetical protein
MAIGASRTTDALERFQGMSMNVGHSDELRIGDILAVEDDERLLEPICPDTGIPYWALLRTPFLRSILYDRLYGAAPFSPFETIPKRKALGALANVLLYNQQNRGLRQSPIWIFATGVGLINDGGLWTNRLSDHFAAAAPNITTTFEDVQSWDWKQLRSNPRTLSTLPVAIAATLYGRRHARRYHETAKSLVEYAAHRAGHLVDWRPSDLAMTDLTVRLARKAAGQVWLYRHWIKMFASVRPRLVIKEEGCYGPSAALISAARDCGITTAEYQHGAISEGHDAYNMAPALHASKAYRATLPDYFLAYGSWWLNAINAPVRGVVIGNPHRSVLAARVSKKLPTNLPTILVLGDGIDDAMYVRWSSELASRVDETHNVLFRPHPASPRAAIVLLIRQYGDMITLDKSADIYHSFANAPIVVSELSTGLFEAIGLVESIYMWKTAKSAFTFPRHPFMEICDIEDFIRQLQRGTQRSANPLREDALWAPDWRSNYLTFLGDVGATPPY